MYKIGDEILITSGTEAGKKATVYMDWTNGQWLVETKEDQRLVILPHNQLVPFDADNEIYAERILQSIDDYL